MPERELPLWTEAGIQEESHRKYQRGRVVKVLANQRKDVGFWLLS